MDLADDVPRDRQLPAGKLKRVQPGARLGHRHRSGLRDAARVEAHCQRDPVQALSGAGRAGRLLAFVPVVPADLLAAVLGAEAGKAKTGAEAIRAPAVLRVVREQARVRLGEGLAARGAGAVDRKQPMLELGALLA